jgi:2-polyprenyl-3-methyl-5-hydroxy-6-metoxy-1,4-benzoquinol methylase
MKEIIQICPVCGKNSFSVFLEVRDYFLTQEDFSIQQCAGCGFKFVNPRPDKNEISRYYQSDDYISHDAGKENIISRIYKIARVYSIKGKFQIVKRYFKSGNILDIGCGTGEFLSYCKSKGFTVTGVEPNPKAGTFAQKVHGINVLNSLNDLSHHNGVFNCISMWHVLEHVHDLNETVEKIKRMLHPGGVFIIAVPNSTSWDAGQYGKFWAAYDVPRHLYHFTETTLNRLVQKHGFEIIHTYPQKLDAFYVSMLSEKYRSGKNNYVKAFINGFWSNFKAGGPQRGHSSQIFVLSVKKA